MTNYRRRRRVTPKVQAPKPKPLKNKDAPSARHASSAHDRFRAKYAPEFDGTDCPLCGQVMSDAVAPEHPRKLTLDHIYPVAGGGDSTPDGSNYQFICRSCNSAKRAKLPASPTPAPPVRIDPLFPDRGPVPAHDLGWFVSDGDW